MQKGSQCHSPYHHYSKPIPLLAEMEITAKEGKSAPGLTPCTSRQDDLYPTVKTELNFAKNVIFTLEMHSCSHMASVY